jgi:hypothetical protein
MAVVALGFGAEVILVEFEVLNLPHRCVGCK